VRVTQQTLAATVLAGLQGNINRLGSIQQKLSSGKEISRPSDSPIGAGSAMLFRAETIANKQYTRNVDDGLGWLGAADNALTATLGQTSQVKALVLQGMSAGSFSEPAARIALAAEVEIVRDAAIGSANTTYLDRPIFGGTTSGAAAYTAAGAYAGDTGQVMRTVGPNTKVRVDSSGPAMFGTGTDQLFTVLTDIANHLRSSPTSLQADTVRLDKAVGTLQSGLANVGTRYSQLTQTRQAADDAVLNLAKSLSDVEDIDLPKTITELQLQQTAYQAALAAGARVVQPSLVDFLK
jgi:flagellar hook-associated protein 3 FlgL